MTVTRLTGGLTPGDANDPRTFPEIFNAAADVIDASEAGLSVVEGEVATLQDDVVELETRGFRIVDTLYFESNGTFTKADFPFLRAIRVKCQGGGGGGGGGVTVTDATVGSGGGGGVYAESFIDDIGSLPASVTVTRGAGGGVGTGAGGSGGVSSFGSLVSANGGIGGFRAGFNAYPRLQSAPNNATAGTGDIVIPGRAGTPGMALAPVAFHCMGGQGGDSFLGHGGNIGIQTARNEDASGFGAGGGGVGLFNTTERNGGTPTPGIVIVELFA